MTRPRRFVGVVGLDPGAEIDITLLEPPPRPRRHIVRGPVVQIGGGSTSRPFGKIAWDGAPMTRRGGPWPFTPNGGLCPGYYAWADRLIKQGETLAAQDNRTERLWATVVTYTHAEHWIPR